LEYRQYTIPRKGKIANVLIYFGGCDNQNLTVKSIQAILALELEGMHIDVVISPFSPVKDHVCSLINGRLEFTLHDNGLPSLAPLMTKADISLGGCGATTWERCCLGLPSLVITLADNQRQIAYELDRLGYVRRLGDASSIDISNISCILRDLISTELEEEWSKLCFSLVDGRGVGRVLERMGINSARNLYARRASPDDEGLILYWANDDLVRKNAFNSDLIINSHMKYNFARNIKNYFTK
jgi:spore coat polysaccharide biosynthesis predicted glycosyltransferase SpsG